MSSQGRTRCPACCVQPVRYAVPADRQKFDIVQSIRTRTLLRQAHPGKRLDGRFPFPAARRSAGLVP